MNVTFIGLGIMGWRMARNLMRHDDVTLTVFNRSPGMVATTSPRSMPIWRAGLMIADAS